MKKLLVLLLVSIFTIVGCSEDNGDTNENGNENEVVENDVVETEEDEASDSDEIEAEDDEDDEDEDESNEGVVSSDFGDSIMLDNGLQVTIIERSLVDAHGTYYVEEDASILVLVVEFENTNPHSEVTGSPYAQLYINGVSQQSQTFMGVDGDIGFVESIEVGETLRGNLVYAAPLSFTASDDVSLLFLSLHEEEVGRLALDLTDLEKEVSDVTAGAGEAAQVGDRQVHEMSGFTVSLGEPTFMTGEEFMDAYPEHRLDIRNQNRWMLIDVEFINESGSDFEFGGRPFVMTDDFDDVYLLEVAMRHMEDDEFDFETPILDGESRSGKLLFMVSFANEYVLIETNPVGGLNSEFIFHFEINLE